MSIWPVLDGVERLQRDVGSVIGSDGRKYVPVMDATVIKLRAGDAYGGMVKAIGVDNDYVFVGGENTYVVKRFNRASGLAYSAQSESLGSTQTIHALVVDDAYVYAGGQPTSNIWKFSRGLTTVASVAMSNIYVYGLAHDADYLYNGGYHQCVYKRRKSDLVEVGQSPAMGGYVWSIALDDAYLYVPSQNPYRVNKVRKSDMSLVGQTATFGSASPSRVVIDETYIYTLAGTWIHKHRKDDLSFVSSVNIKASVSEFALVDGYLLMTSGQYLLIADASGLMTYPTGTGITYDTGISRIVIGPDQKIYFACGSGDSAKPLWECSLRWLISNYVRRDN